MRDAEQRVHPQRLVDDPVQRGVVVGVAAAAPACVAALSSTCAIASDICTTAVLKNAPCRYQAVSWSVNGGGSRTGQVPCSMRPSR